MFAFDESDWSGHTVLLRLLQQGDSIGLESMSKVAHAASVQHVHHHRTTVTLFRMHIRSASSRSVARGLVPAPEEPHSIVHIQ